MTQTGIGGVGGTGPVAPGVDPIARARERATLEQAAHGFEAIFTRQLVGAMRGASLGEGFDQSSAVEEFREMADARMADDLAAKGGLGIAKLILQQLDRQP
jgi:flagellar protein FlgJ